MALDYAATAQLMQDLAFRDRVKVACLKFANYILIEVVTTPGHSSRLRWAQNTVMTPDQAAVQVMPTLVMDPQVQADGAAITDVALQTATEASINKLL